MVPNGLHRQKEHSDADGIDVRLLSVIIPFFQREPGILSRALTSITLQHIPAGWLVEVIVVDDGSPRQARDELRDLDFREPLRLKVIRQENGGVAAARNRGLDEATPSATLIAFLDSDDVWLPDHLARAIDAHESGFDFYFTDNRRLGYHSSHVRSHCAPATGRFIAAAQQKTGILEVPTDFMVGLILQEFPTQASTVIYKASIAAHLRFNTGLKSAGEDVLFFTALAATARRVGFDLDSYVECGGGLNMYFANLSWDSPLCLAIMVDKLLAYRIIGKTITLSSSNRAWNDGRVSDCRRELGFHILRNLAKHPARVPTEIWRLIRRDPKAALALPVDMTHAAWIALMDWKQSK
jgi:succinoglycan biosynthesis protein ExoW